MFGKVVASIMGGVLLLGSAVMADATCTMKGQECSDKGCKLQAAGKCPKAAQQCKLQAAGKCPKAVRQCKLQAAGKCPKAAQQCKQATVKKCEDCKEVMVNGKCEGKNCSKQAGAKGCTSCKK